jgi:DNA transposition AAA+ family ATPase
MGLIYGEPGLGKTYAITWWAAQNDAILIRSANLMSARWLLEEIIEELGEIPYNKFSDIFNQVIAQLIKTPRLIIVDETDYLTIDSRAVETLRDIHDKTNVPIVLVGMGTANKRLQRHKHLYDRLLEIIKFEPFCKQDITSIIDQLSEVQFTDCAKKLLYSRTNRFRQLVKTISKAEQVAKSNGIKEIDEITLKEVLKNDEIDTEEIEFSNENS